MLPRRDRRRDGAEDDRLNPRASVDLLAYSGFPGARGNAQIDLVTENVDGLRRVARENGWKLSGVKKGFLVQGDDRIGAVHRHLARLGDAGVSVAAAAVPAVRGRYDMILWVKDKDYARAARALGARQRAPFLALTPLEKECPSCHGSG